MSFWIYRKSDNRYSRLGPVKLSGAQGILARFLGERSDEDTPYAWRLDHGSLMRMAGPDLDPALHVLVFDLLPHDTGEICLYKISVIQGYSTIDDTDLIMGTTILSQRSAPENGAQAYKEGFEAAAADGQVSFEPMRLTGGTSMGTYRWASPKMDIGATLCSAK